MGAMDELLDAAAVDDLRARLRAADPDRPFAAVGGARGAVDGLKLRARTDVVAAAILEDVPGDLAPLAAVVRSALGDPGFAGWTIWPVTEAVADRALADADPAAFEDGLALLAALTPRLTAEFAIRGFLDADLDRALAAIGPWTASGDEGVRRLASEGTRPYLPWAVRVRAIVDRPDATLPILDALRDDPSPTVRRSVANHLNDLARHAPALVVATAERWTADPGPHTAATVRHGLRTLTKRGDPGALAVQGFAPVPVLVSAPRLDRDRVAMPGHLGFEVDVTNAGDAPARLAVDYVVHYVKADGRLAPKVFKLATPTLGPGETARLQKRHAFRAMTTRRHHPGEHALEIQVNGERSGRTTFVLDVETGRHPGGALDA